MATVAQVAKASLQKILVQASEAPIEASELQDFIFAMNNFMLDLDANGVTLGYTEVSDPGDDVTIPTGALRGLINNMAVESAPEYDGTVTQTLMQLAISGMHTMEKIGQSIPTSAYPSTLPIGHGNEGTGTQWTNHFYPDQEELILAETTGAIALESGTEAAI